MSTQPQISEKPGETLTSTDYEQRIAALVKTIRSLETVNEKQETRNRELAKGIRELRKESGEWQDMAIRYEQLFRKYKTRWSTLVAGPESENKHNV